MLKLEKTIKVVKLNRKGTGVFQGLREKDLITVSFNVDGCGGYSPKVDVLINYIYRGSPFAKTFNENLFEEKRVWRKGEYVTIPPIIKEYKEVD